jgi:SAM-dependent methyltransferase
MRARPKERPVTTTVLHIAKTGGAALKEALRPVCESHALTLCGHAVTLRDVPTGQKVVFSVRHPVLRFVSGFNSRLRKGRPRNDDEWSLAERAAFERFATARDLAEALSRADPVLRDQAERAMRGIVHIGTTFADWLVSADYLLERSDDVLLPLWQPELDADFERLKELLDLPADVGLPRDPVGSHRTPPGFDTELSHTAVANLERWYAADLPIYRACLDLRARRIAGSRPAAVALSAATPERTSLPPRTAAAAPRLTVVFILSSRHSGSTWLNLVLGSTSWGFNVGEYIRPFVMPGHVACRLCEAEGLPRCTLLHGIEGIAADDAFTFAAERSGKRVLIDASKNIAWCRRFLEREDIDAKIVHLFRHPCGYAESLVRRQSEYSYARAFDLWENTNQEIDEFARSAGYPSLSVCYEELADDPDRYFAPLCEFIGAPWESGAVAYWNAEHHGLGANGASSVYLRGRKVLNYVTRDDEFYAHVKDGPPAADRRWQARLTAEVHAEAMRRPYVAEVRARFSEGTWSEAPGQTASVRTLPDALANGLPAGSEHYRAFVGPPDEYDLMGAAGFRLLTTLGLREHHKVLDFGCGSLRLGRLLIPYLASGKYVGLEPNRWLVDDAIERQLGANLMIIKSPTFFDDDGFAADRCGTDFDFIVAQSVLSHAGPDLLRRALAGFRRALAPDGVALVTVRLSGSSALGAPAGEGWVYPDDVAYAPEALDEAFRAAGLHARLLPFHHPRETWYALALSERSLPPATFAAHLSGETSERAR